MNFDPIRIDYYGNGWWVAWQGGAPIPDINTLLFSTCPARILAGMYEEFPHIPVQISDGVWHYLMTHPRNTGERWDFETQWVDKAVRHVAESFSKVPV